MPAKDIVSGPRAVERILRADDEHLRKAIVTPALVAALTGAGDVALALLRLPFPAEGHETAHGAFAVGAVRADLEGQAIVDQVWMARDVLAGLTLFPYSSEAAKLHPPIARVRDALELCRVDADARYERDVQTQVPGTSLGSARTSGWTALTPEQLSGQAPVPTPDAPKKSPTPADEARALALLDEAFRAPDFVPAPELLVLAAHLAVDQSRDDDAAKYLGRIFSENDAHGSYVLPVILALPTTRRVALSGALASSLGIDAEECRRAGPQLIDAAHERLIGGRHHPEGTLPMRELLEAISQLTLSDDDVGDDVLPQGARLNRWVGAPTRASDDQIAATEARLGLVFPPSYREFLTVSNGFGPIVYGIDRLHPVEQVGWLRDVDPEHITIWTDRSDFADQPIHPEEQMWMDALAGSVVIGDADSGYLLLVPELPTPDQECTVWYFTSWNPGERPYSSFRTFLEEFPSRETDV